MTAGYGVLTWASLAAAWLAGCAASVDRATGFEDVQGIVAERSGHRIRWNGGDAGDAEVETAIEALLQEDLTADTAVQIALLNNRDLRATYEELGIAQADLLRAGLLENPVFDAEVRFPEGGGRTELDLGVAQGLLSVFFLPLQKRIAEASFEAAKLRVAGAVLDLAGETKAAFYRAQAAEQLREMRRTVGEATEASYDLATRLHEAGNIRDLDLASERALHEQARLDLVAAELEVVETRERLSRLLGLWGSRTKWAIGTRLADPPAEVPALEGLESRAIERSLDLGAARQVIERTARQLGFTRDTALIPSGEIGIAAEREVDGLWTVGPSVRAPVPLFDQGRPAIARAASELRRLQERYAADAVAIRSEVRSVASRVLALAARADHLRRVLLPARQRVVEETQKQYNAMQVGAFQLLQAKQQEIDAGGRYIETIRDYWLARTALEQLASGRRAHFDRPAWPRGDEE